MPAMYTHQIKEIMKDEISHRRLMGLLKASKRERERERFFFFFGTLKLVMI